MVIKRRVGRGSEREDECLRFLFPLTLADICTSGETVFHVDWGLYPRLPGHL